MTLMFEEDVDRAMVLLALETFYRGKIGCDRDFSELILIYVKQGDKKNVDRSNEEIDKIMEFMDKEIGTVKDFLSSLS